MSLLASIEDRSVVTTDRLVEIGPLEGLVLEVDVQVFKVLDLLNCHI